jgi:hypothetical protein
MLVVELWFVVVVIRFANFHPTEIIKLNFTLTPILYTY